MAHYEIDDREFARLKDRGMLCVMWTYPAKDMDSDKLLAFIGYLDEQLTMLRASIGQTGSR